ncbi:MAG TPA: glycosyltransferase, partial [Bacteroidetes bacterium]|nr:glycosyltransferase [Bacteroidota bacterium]
MKIVIIGTAYPFRGGIASFNERMAIELINQGHDVIIYTFTLQYPSVLFPGKTQYSDDPKPENLKIIPLINSINPFNWIKSGLKIRREKADIIITKFWIPFMGPALGTILRIAKNKNTKNISVIDNIIPHEERIGDKLLAQYYVNAIDKFIVMSSSVKEDMKLFTTKKPVLLIPHPIYDNYGEILDKKAAAEYLRIDPNGKYVMFFGFIRDYKGLDLLLEAMADNRIQQAGIKCIVAGEYYGNKDKYDSLIKKLGIESSLILKTEFISNNEVKYYFSAADLIVQPYKSATQSGISQLAYHFEKPMVVTNVGGLPEIVENGKSGYVV